MGIEAYSKELVSGMRDVCRMDKYTCKELRMTVVPKSGDASKCVVAGQVRARFNTSIPQIIYFYDYKNKCSSDVYAYAKINNSWQRFPQVFSKNWHGVLEIVYEGTYGAEPTAFGFSTNPNASPDSFTPKSLPLIDTNIPGQCGAGASNPNISGYSVINAVNGTVVESIPLVGMPFSLTYSSDRFTKGTGFNKVASLGGWTLSMQHQVSRPDGLIYYGYGGLRNIEAMADSSTFTDSNGNYVFNESGIIQMSLDLITSEFTWIFGYDNAMRLEWLEDGFGQRYVISYAGAGSIITSPGGQATQLYFDKNGFLSKVINPNQEEYALNTDSTGLLKTFRKPNGAESRFFYDANGTLVRDESNSGGTIELSKEFDISKGTQTVFATTAMGRRTAFISKESLGGSQNMVVNAYGSTAQTDMIEDAYGVRDEYGGFGISRLVPHPFWGRSLPYVGSYEYKVRDLIALKVTTDKEIREVSGNNVEITSITFQNDPTRTFQVSHHIKEQTFMSVSPAGRRASVRVQENGLPIWSKLGNLYDLNITYDGGGRLSSVRQGERFQQISYDKFGNLKEVADSAGNKAAFEYDRANRPTQATFVDGRVMKFSYDSNGQMTKLTPPGRESHSLSYNLLGSLVSYMPPSLKAHVTQQIGYTYNKDKQLEKISKPDGEEIKFFYDHITGLLKSIDGDGQYQFNYGQNTDLVRSIVSSNGNSLEYVYKGAYPVGIRTRGEVVSNVTYGFNKDTTLSGVGVAGADGIIDFFKILYDKDFLVVKVGDLSIQRNDFGSIGSSALGGIQQNNSYDGYGELSSRKYIFKKKEFYSQDYKRDAVGRIVEVSEKYEGKAARYSYQYDFNGRLIGSNSPSGSRTISYDKNGNRLIYTLNGQIVQATVDEQDRLISYGNLDFEYNKNGEMLSKVDKDKNVQTLFKYDVFGNLIGAKLSDGRIIDYVLDGQNRRVGKKVNGKLVQAFVYQSQNQIVAELDAKGKVVKRFVYGTQSHVPDYFVSGSKKFRIITDYVGTPRLVVDADSGKIIERFEFDEFGLVKDIKAPSSIPFGFAGGLFDRDTGLVHFGAREYDPAIGRWTSKDPILFSGGQANLYSYAFNDPVNFIDPSGHFGFPGAIAGAILGGASAGLASYASKGSKTQIWQSIAIGATTGFAGGMFGASSAFVANAVAQMTFGNGLNFGDSILAAIGVKMAGNATNALSKAYGSPSVVEHFAIDTGVSMSFMPIDLGLELLTTPSQACPRR
ncbi:tRNA(Glu)-specific nuclease WapA precursor [compost metagenome]